jgi:hypothetical protein
MVGVCLSAILLTACQAGHEARVHQKLDAYVGQSVAQLALVLGTPTTQFAAGAGKMAFEWEHSTESHIPGIAAPVGNTLVYSAPHSQQGECRVSVVAHASVPKPTLGDWIIETWHYHSTHGGDVCI